jgi:DNA-directed RNA polymerase specialized sigma24 family protein
MSKETGWLHQLSAGEPTAWARLLDEWSPRLYHYLTANGVSEAEAQALLPPIFSAVVQKVVGEPPVANLTVLIFALAYPHMVRYSRQRLTTSRLQALSSPTTTPVDSATIHLRQALQQFSPEVQQIALLYYLCEVTVAEISQIVHQPALVVKNALNQVKRQLCR